MGGLDRGLRVGGRCLHRTTGRTGVVLGMVRPSTSLAKVQWDDGEASTRYDNLVFIIFLIHVMTFVTLLIIVEKKVGVQKVLLTDLWTELVIKSIFDFCFLSLLSFYFRLD